MSEKDLTSKVRELKEMKLMRDEMDALITGIEDELKAELTARETNEMIVDVYKVRWTPVNSTRVDTTALKKEMPEIAARYIVTSTTRRFSVA